MKKWYIPLILLFITAFVPWMKEVKRVQEAEARAEISVMPRMGVVEIQKEINRLKYEFTEVEKGNIKPDPLYYWRLLDGQQRVEWQVDIVRRIGSNAEVAHYGRLVAMSSNLRSRIGDVQRAYIAHFGGSKMADLAYIAPRTFVKPEIPAVPNRRLELFLTSYLWSIIPMFFVFVLQLLTRNLMVWPEIPRLVLASAFYPIGLFVYPKGVRRAEQVKWAMQFVAQLASVAIGFLGGGVANLVKAQTAGSNGKSQKQSQKKGVSHTFGYGIELYPQSSGIDAGLMVSPWYSHSHVLPKGFSLSGFGFVEMGEHKKQLFTNNSLNLSHAKSGGAMFTAEFGGTATATLIQIGPRFNLVKIPGFPNRVAKTVKSVVVGSLWRIRGPTHYREWYLSWVSREASLPGGWKLSSEGFMRFRPGPRAAGGEPQLILRHPRIPHVQFMSEFWMIGTQPTVRLGVQFAK